MRTLKINRVFNNKKENFNDLISNIIEEQLESKIDALYNQQQPKADTVAQISEIERRVA